MAEQDTVLQDDLEALLPESLVTVAFSPSGRTPVTVEFDEQGACTITAEQDGQTVHGHRLMKEYVDYEGTV
jgi:hypothetical protein